MSSSTISVIIITKNEEKNLEKCLSSIQWADEIIIVDSGSTDNTIEIAKKYTDKIHTHKDWKGFGVQKSIALNYASSDWVLSLDADEVISEQLQKEIMTSIKSITIDAYYLPRLSYLLNKPIYHGGWYPDYILRLFKRSKAKFSEDAVHEKILCEGNTGNLTNPIHHYSYQNLSQLIRKFDSYTSIGAEELYKKNKKISFLNIFVRAKLTFFKHYILKLGFLDGREGLIVALSAAETVYYKYLKLYYLNNQNGKK